MVRSAPRGSMGRLGLNRHRQQPAHCAPPASTGPRRELRPAGTAPPARIRRFWALLRHHCASLALHTLSQWKVVATSLIVCAMLATLGLMVGRAAPAFKVHTRATRAALPAHYAVPESTQQAQHRPSAPTARPANSRVRRGTRFSTKQGGVEEEEVVHVQCRRLQLYLLGEDLLP